MRRFYTRWSMAIVCRLRRAAHEPCTRSCWSAGPRTRWSGRRLRHCSGNWRSSLCCLRASTASRRWPCAEWPAPRFVLCAASMRRHTRQKFHTILLMVLQHELAAMQTLKPGFHCPSSRAELTGNGNRSPVNLGHQLGLWKPGFILRYYRNQRGCLFQLVCLFFNRIIGITVRTTGFRVVR